VSAFANSLLPLAVLLPLIGGLGAFLLPRLAAAIGALTAIGNLRVTGSVAVQLTQNGVLTHLVGGWGAPLGIDLMADGPASAMLLITGIVGTGISLYSAFYFKDDAAKNYWPIWLFLITALNALFLSRDLFNLYVTLEMLGLSAVALTALEGGKKPLVAALRYLFAGLGGSLLYLLGVALVYHAAGSVAISDMGSLEGPIAQTALVLMTVGLLVKSALFPFHFWLPAAHGSAPAPVSAALSALVLKGGFFILLRLWLDVFPVPAAMLFTPLSWLGAGAVLWGSMQAILQTRMKLLIAYSSVAQIGYLFLALPLARNTAEVWGAIILMACAHALAKSALFLAAGNVLSATETDELATINRDGMPLTLTSASIGLAGISIMGLPPSGGFSAKWLLLSSAITQQQWGIVIVLLLGGLMAVAYVYRLMAHVFIRRETATTPASSVSTLRQLPVVVLALLSLALGFAALPWLELTMSGGAFMAAAGGA